MQSRKKDILVIQQFGLLVVIGVALGGLLIILDKKDGQHSSVLPVTQYVPRHVYSKNIHYCTGVCYKPPEQLPQSRIIKRAGSTSPTRPAGVTRVSDIPPKAKNPNSIKISLFEAPTILAKVKMVNGKPTCAKKNDKGRKSEKYNTVHIDRECCLDPDEVPNPRCQY